MTFSGWWRHTSQEAVEAFIEECETMGTLEGTLEEALEEAGFMRPESDWLPREPVVSELVPVG